MTVTAPAARKPTAWLKLNGKTVPVKSVCVTQSKTKRGDSFKAKTAMSALPAGLDLTTATDIDAQVFLNGAQIFDGVLDHTDYHWDSLTIELSGRDKGSALMDKTTSQKFLNQQPTQIVQQYAEQHGLKADIDQPEALAGKQYSADLAKITHRGSQWSTINELADLFGMDCYITGATVYFKNTPEQLPTYQLTYVKPPAPGSNMMRLETSRNHMLGRPVKTNVRSRHHKKKQTFTAQVQSEGSGEPLVYNHVIPGMTQDQVKRVAQKKHDETIAHELSITGLEIPGDETLNARFLLNLTGTGTAFDTQYQIIQVEHDASVDGGYICRIGCKTKGKGKKDS